MDDATLIALVLIGLATLYVYVGPQAAGTLAPALQGFTDLLPTSSAPVVNQAPAAVSVSGPVVSSSGPGTIDPSTVTIVNGADVRTWPQTTLITQIDVAPDNVRINFTARDNGQWPNQDLPGGGPSPLQYTVWLFLNINGQWVGSGFIEMWQGRDGVGDGIFDFVNNWFYSGRWAPMTGHVIQPNETIGFMVTAGDERDGANTAIAERSNIVTIPAVSSGSFSFS